MKLKSNRGRARPIILVDQETMIHITGRQNKLSSVRFQYHRLRQKFSSDLKTLDVGLSLANSRSKSTFVSKHFQVDPAEFKGVINAMNTDTRAVGDRLEVKECKVRRAFDFNTTVETKIFSIRVVPQ